MGIEIQMECGDVILLQYTKGPQKGNSLRGTIIKIMIQYYVVEYFCIFRMKRTLCNFRIDNNQVDPLHIPLKIKVQGRL